MTDPTTTPDLPPQDVQEPPQEPAEAPPEVAGQDEVDGQDPVAAARREAASYRRRLRDAEAERDRLAESVTSYQRLEAETIATGNGIRGLASGSDLWSAGVQLADLLDDSGRVDPDKTKAAVEQVLTERPHWRRQWGDVGQGIRGTSPGPDSTERFQTALRFGTTGE